MDTIEAKNILARAGYCLKHRVEMLWQADARERLCTVCEMEKQQAEFEEIRTAKKVLGWL